MNRIKAYYYLTKPGIIYGNVMTAAAGFLLAAAWEHIDFGLLLATLAGTSLVIASACVVNNFIDRGIDKKMARTQKRALVKGTISGQAALLYAAILGITGFACLIFWVNAWVVGLGAIAFIDYIVLYGYSKRHSVYGTLVGSIAGASPITAGYLAVTGRPDMGAVLLFLIMTFWQMPHFYAIAMFRLKDYTAANIPVLPRRRSVKETQWQILFYIIAFGAATVLLSARGYAGVTFALIMTFTSLWWLSKGIRGFHSPDAQKWARQMFGTSLYVLLILSGALAIGSVLP